MGITFTPLRVTLAKKNLKITQLQEMIGCSSSTIAKIAKDQPLNLTTIEEICRVLEVTPAEVFEFIE